MDLLKRPWILDTLMGAFQGRSGDGFTITDGELVVGNKKPYVQLIRIKSTEPVWVATLSDKRVRITAEFSESCVSAFEARGKPLKALRGGVFQLKNYKFVLRRHDTARFDGGVTLQQPLGDQNAGISIPEKSLASALTSSVRIIIDDMVFLSGEGNPEFGEPRAVGQFKELQQLLRQLPVKKSLLPGLKSRTSANATSNRRRSVMVEHDGESSSQPFATQAHTMMHFSDSDDGCESIASQLFDDGDSTLQFATQAHQQPRSKAHKSSSSKVGGQPETATLDPNASDVASVTGVHNRTKAIHDYSDLEFSGTMSSAPIRAAQNHGAGEGLSMNAPPSSPPVPPQMHDQSSRSKKKVLLEPQIVKPLLPLHPGWEGITEVTARMAKIPQGQRKKLEKSGCWWPNTDPKHALGYDKLLNVQLVPKTHPPRTRVIPRPSTTPQKHLQLTPKAWSRASTEQSSDDEAVEWSSSPAHTPTRQLREELEVAPPISIAAPRSSHDLLHNTNEISRQDHQATLENPAQSQESFNQLSDYEPVPWSPSSPVRSPGTQLREELGAEPPSSIGAPSSPQAPDAAEATGWNFQPAEPELPSRPLISQGDNPEARDQSDHIVTERQTDDGPMADDKSKAADELDVCGNPPLSTPSYSPVNAPISTSWPTSVAPHTEQDSHHKTSGQSLKDSSISHNELQTGNGPVAGDKPEAGDEPKVGDKSIADNRSTIGSELDNSINSVDESKGEASDTNQRRTTSKRVTRAANGIIKTRRATEPLDSQMVRPSTKSRRAFKRAHPRSPSVDDIDDDDDDDDDVSPSHSYPRARSEEPPFPIRDPHGVTPVDKYGTLVAQQVREWKKKRQKEKLKKYLEGQYSFTDSDEDDEGELKSEGTEVEVEEKPPDKEVSSASSAAHAAVQTVPAVVLVTVPKRYTQVSDDDDDDIPCAPAIPLTQKGVSSGSSAKKASEPTGNKAQPPSTAPSLVPIVQVKETPYRRASGLVNPPINGKAQLFEVHDTNVEEMVPATNEQQSSSIENKDEELERQSASFIRMQSGLNVMQESSGCIDDQIEKAHKEVSAVEVPGTQAEHKPNDSAKPHVTLQKWRAKMLKSADFASQEIRDAQDDISTRIEEEHRKFLAAQALGGMSLAAKQISINTEIRLRGAAQPSSSIHGKKPTTTSAPSSSRKRPLALLSTPIATKKARVSSPHSTPRSATARSLASILATSPGLPSSPPSRPQLFNSRPKPAHTSSPPLRSRLSSGRPSLTLTSAPLYAPKPHGVSGLPPPSIAKLKPPDRPKPRGPPPPPLLPKDVKIIPMDYDSDSESGSNIIGPYKLISPQQHPPGVLYAPKPKCKATPEEEERKSQEQQPAQPQTELYAGFRPRSIAVPGYEKLSDNQRRELDERRRRFFGTHREVEKFIGTPWTSDRGEAVTAQRKSRWSGDGDLWWMEDDTPMRRFVTRFKGLKTVRKELGEDV